MLGETVLGAAIFSRRGDRTSKSGPALRPDGPANTTTAFLQALYPPSGKNEDVGVQELNTGTDYTAPFNGYQYVVLHSEDENSPNTI
ncbi:hypothetical protein FSHL1_002879 [Fusarium sambucinum]